MKKKLMLHRFGAMVMALTLSLSLMAAPAFAAGDTGSNTVTVNNAVAKAEYKLYKLLQLEAATEEYTKEDGTTAEKVVSCRCS